MLMKYMHPHIQLSIYDNSYVYEETAGNGTVFIMPYFSSKGESNKVKYFNDARVFLQETGTPNFKKYGQAHYQAYNWLTGGGRLYGCRLMPDDSYYANIVLNVKTLAEEVPVYERNSDGSYRKDANGMRIQATENGVGVTKPGVRIRLKYQAIPYLTNSDKKILTSRLNTMNSEDAIDENGYKNHYVFGFIPKGRGKYGNKYSIQIEPDYSLESTYDFRLYALTVLEESETGVISVNDGPYQFSTFPDAMALARYSMSLQSIVDEYCRDIDCFFSEDAYDTLLDDIMEATKDEEGNYTFDNLQTIDFLFGVDKDKNSYEGIIIDEESADLSFAEGIKFISGSDGSLDPKGTHIRRDEDNEIVYDENNNPIEDKNTQTYVEGVKDDLLNNFYIGLIDPSIYNTIIYEFDVAMDANFSVGTKYNIVDFCKQRNDTFGYIDSGILASVEATLNWRQKQFQTNHYMISIQGQAFKVNDPFTNRSIEVTPCYHLSRMIPAADEAYGISMPLAGHKRGIIEDYESINWIPDEDEKEQLFLARINYIEQDINYIVRMSQNTSQYLESALARENNVRVLLKMVRSAKKACKLYYHERALPGTLQSLRSNIYNSLSVWLDNNALENLSVTVTQSKYEKQRRIVHIYITCVFTYTLERFVIDFSVNAE